ncbi:MAG: Secreted protein, partial [Actinomyces urogenitalis DORA_12]
ELPQPAWPPLVVDHDAEGEAPAEYHATRWWRAAQHDFASRLAWSLTSRFEDANHPPVVSVVGGPSREQCPEGGLRRAVQAGERVRLQAEAADPDGDAVALRWWAYPEAGPRPCPVAPELDDDGQGGAVVSVPQEAEPGQEIHLVVEGTDDGVPALTRYQRVVLVVG